MADIFCKIIAREVPADFIFDEPNWMAIHDIKKDAPVHVLIVPKKHIDSVLDVTKEDGELMKELMLAVKKVSDKMGISEDGFRVVINHGVHGGQIVPHLHIHVVGGKPLD